MALRTVAHPHQPMSNLVFYIGLGLGLAAACGLRPYLPALLAGVLGSAGSLGVSFTGHFHFLQAGWWLIAVTLVFINSYLLQLRLGQERFQAVAQPRDRRPGRGRRRAAVRGHARRARRCLVAGADRGLPRRRSRRARVWARDPSRPPPAPRPQCPRSADRVSRRRLAATRGPRRARCTRSATSRSRCSPGFCGAVAPAAGMIATPVCASCAADAVERSQRRPSSCSA